MDPKEAIREHEYGMVYDDAASNWGHRDNILAPQHQFVNIGIAFTETRLAMAQHFEDLYIRFTQPPTLRAGTLSLTGSLDSRAGKLQAIDIYYDPLPKTLSHQELLAQPRYYSIGESDKPTAHIIPPPPSGQYYVGLGPEAVVAQTWSASSSTFSVAGDLTRLISKPGVYTVLVWAHGFKAPLTTISLFLG